MLPDPHAQVNCTDRRPDVVALAAVLREAPRAAQSRREERVGAQRYERPARARVRVQAPVLVLVLVLVPVPVAVLVLVLVRRVSLYPRVIPQDRCLPES